MKRVVGWNEARIVEIESNMRCRKYSQSQSYFTTDGRSVSMSWLDPFGAHDQILLFPFFCRKIAFLFSLGALSDERTGLQFTVQSVSGQSRGGLATIHYCLLWDYWVPFPSPLTTCRDYGGSILTRLRMGQEIQWVDPSVSPSTAVWLVTHSEDQYNLKDSARVSVRSLIPRVRFIPQMVLVVRNEWFHRILHLIPCIGLHGLGLLLKISTSFSVLVSGLCMLHQHFYCTIFLLSPTDMGYKVTEVSSY
jgi:hypothetical protein